MAMVITVAQQKGGAGKTTIAANLAAGWAATRRVAVIDIDPQRSLTRWHGLRAARGDTVRPIDCLDLSGWRLAAGIERLRDSHDIVLIDSPPRIDTDARLAIRSASLILVPVQPSVADLWAADGTLALAAEERRPARVLLNRAAAGRMRTLVEGALAQRGVPALRAALGNRAPFAHGFAAGLGVIEASPRSPAADEMRALLAEIEGLS